MFGFKLDDYPRETLTVVAGLSILGVGAAIAKALKQEKKRPVKISSESHSIIDLHDKFKSGQLF